MSSHVLRNHWYSTPSDYSMALEQGDCVDKCEDVWRRKYTALQTRCMDYQKVGTSGWLFIRLVDSVPLDELHALLEG